MYDFSYTGICYESWNFSSVLELLGDSRHRCDKRQKMIDCNHKERVYTTWNDVIKSGPGLIASTVHLKY
jgi:hypothetical protein